MDAQTKAAVDAPAEHTDFARRVLQGYRQILSYAFSLTGRRDVADDLVQEALIAALKGFSKFDPDASFVAWVRGIVRHKYLKWAQRPRHASLSEDALDAIDREFAKLDQTDALGALRACIAKLPDSLRETVESYYMSRESCASISRRSGMNEEAIKKRLQRARATLHECIQLQIGD